MIVHTSRIEDGQILQNGAKYTWTVVDKHSMSSIWSLEKDITGQ